MEALAGVDGLRSVGMFISDLRPSRRVDKKERSCSFLEIEELKLP